MKKNIHNNIYELIKIFLLQFSIYNYFYKDKYTL